MKVFKNQRKIAATSDKLFEAIKDETLLVKWWGPEGFSTTTSTFEFKKEGEWKFEMHGPDGANYPNEIIFKEITEPNKVVMRHSVEPFFTLTVAIEDVEGGAVVHWWQDFDSEEVAKSISHIAKSANEQVLDKLQALVEGS